MSVQIETSGRPGGPHPPLGCRGPRSLHLNAAREVSAENPRLQLLPVCSGGLVATQLVPSWCPVGAQLVPGWCPVGARLVSGLSRLVV